ncbi:CoA-binding protein [Alkalihalobacillus trypoxylicola]|uniref:CoA-binding protein n=1 Tax=Alkalihalobacillus trypoxylicola TaxID=519424 RepID=A0A162CMP4_9BACI|nr:CoA-binding protein [Alkalihalobacillus trypoxylicola]KYG25580.1 CoA-binding protein [Alkalihalobacillus trypoxylicola]GAF66624.1 CoA-binding domain-containing protein [Bacillus sp. TS-2]
MAFTNPSNEQIKEILHQYKNVAVVGLSDNPERTSYMVSQAMQKAGYKIIPVNPNVSEVLEEKAYSSLSEVKEKVDIVNVFRRSEFLPSIAKEAVSIEAPVFWAQLGVVDEEAAAYLLENKVKTVMDRCIKVEHAKFK